MEKHPLHIKNPELQTSPEVKRAVELEERQTGEKMPNDPALRIEAYLKRLEKLALDPEKTQKRKDLGDVLHTERPRALSLLREMILNEYVRPNKERMAEAAAQVEERAARQMGIQEEYDERTLEQRGDIAVGDLQSSLDEWIKYLSDPNEPYPTWFRYYAFRNILNLGEYDKDKQEFPKRSKGTFKLFPDVDRGALAYVEERMEAAQDEVTLNRICEAQKELWGTPEADLFTKEKAKAFANLSFAKQYAEGIKQNGEISPELRAETKGEWVRYKQEEDPKELWLSLQNKGTAWCTRGYPTAKTQLDGGDFYVYYTLDSTGNPAIPRIAIRMEGDKKIAENPRGVLDSQQNLEPNMAPILEEKLKEFGNEADQFKKKSQDMRSLTALEKKHEKGEVFTRDDLTFLYEINSKIEGFGYGGKDPRVMELRKVRNAEEDMLAIFECSKGQIAHVPSEINKNTKAYVGQLEPGIFQKLLENLEHVYTSFPERKIRWENILIGGRDFKKFFEELDKRHIRIEFEDWKKVRDTVQKIERDKIDVSRDTLIFLNELVEKQINISNYAKSMFKNREFVPGKNLEEATLIRLTVADLGFKTSATTDQIYERAQALGLELCPPDAGLHYRFQYQNQPLNEWLLMGMKQIAASDGVPDVFSLERDAAGQWLRDGWANLGHTWLPGHEFVFRLRKLKT